MHEITIDSKQLIFTQLDVKKIDSLIQYLKGLSSVSKSRFGPHPYTKEGIHDLVNNTSEYKLYVAMDVKNNTIIAYTIIKLGWLDFEYPRLSSYNLSPSNFDCTIAPSVADSWQNKGLGSEFLQYLINELKTKYSINRIFLWGGVQSSNDKAVAFYKKNGFKVLGEFEYNGFNLDMVLVLD